MASPESAFNPSSPSVRRITREMRELADATDEAFIAQACEEDIFEWHFALLGPPNTAFEGGIYHGRIILPAEYPFAPPSFVLLTANGRFETNAKICLSITPHHPKQWQPSWSVRTALTAIRAFFPTPAEGAVGSLEWSDDVRRELAKASVSAGKVTFTHGNERRQALSESVHRRMLERMDVVMAREAGLEVADVSDGRRAEGDANETGANDMDANEEDAVEEDAVEEEEDGRGAEATEDEASESASSSNDGGESESESSVKDDITARSAEMRRRAMRTEAEIIAEMERDPRVVPIRPWPDDVIQAPYIESEQERTERIAMRTEELRRTKKQLDVTALALAAAIAAILIKRAIVDSVVASLQ